MAEISSNAVPFEVITEATDDARTGLTLEVYNYSDPFQKMDFLPFRTDLKVLDEVGGPGGGSFRVAKDDPKVLETPSILNYRNVFKVRLDGKVIGGFLGLEKNTNFIDPKERSGEYDEISGGGFREWFHDAVVEPYGGIRGDSQQSRVFSFASERGSWYKPADWDEPTRVQKYNMDPNSGPFGTAPAEWPDAPDAHWIWGENNSKASPAPEGVNYFRFEFFIPESEGTDSYSIFAAAREHFDVFVDGQKVIEAHETDAWAETWRADFDLNPGNHILAARVRANGTNPAGFIAAFFKAGDAEAETEAELISVTGQLPLTWYNQRINALQAQDATLQQTVTTRAHELNEAEIALSAAQTAYNNNPNETTRAQRDAKADLRDKADRAHKTAEDAREENLLELQATIANRNSFLEYGTFENGWRVNSYPDPAPGWTPGEIMLTLLKEAEDRGVRFPTWLTPTFTATTASDGAAWTRALDWSFDVGTEYYDVIEKLEELVCDLWIDPDSLELHMYASRGTRRDSQAAGVPAVKFEVGRNVLRAAERGTSDIKNSLLMSTEDGWQSIADGETNSIAKFGRIEGFVSTGASGAVSGDVASRVFKARAEPETSSTYDVIDVDEARPYRDFWVGDWTLAPSPESEHELASRRVMSISISENSVGQPVFAIEFDTIYQDAAMRYERWLQTTSDGTLGGTLANVSGGAGSASATPAAQTTRKGPQGIRGPRGFPGLYNRGEWDSFETYVVSDVVWYQGSFWVSSAETTERPSDTADDWIKLDVVPESAPSSGITMRMMSDVALPSASAGNPTTLDWSLDVYKSAIQHDLLSPMVIITEPGPYLISGEFYVSGSTGAQRDYQVQVNGVTVAYARSKPVNSATHLLMADIPGILYPLSVGDVVRVVTTSSSSHTFLSGTSSWFSLVKVVGARGDKGETGQGLNWRGAWAQGSTYALYDIVRVDGSSYICVMAHFASAATRPGTGADSGPRWNLFNSRGDTGLPSTVPGPPGTSLTYRGSWIGTASYSVGDTVTLAGDLYVANTANSGQSPDSSPEWDYVNSGGGGGSGYVRTVTSLSAVTGDGSFEVGGDSFRLISISADGPCRIRLYRSPADRAADAPRDWQDAPDVQGVVLAEFRWEEATTYWATGFVSSLSDSSTTVHYRVDGGPATLDIKWIGSD